MAQVTPSLLYQPTSSVPNSLIQAEDGNFYGTTNTGGPSLNEGKCFDANGNDVGCGTIFRINGQGALTVLYNFCGQSTCTDGAQPNGIIQGGDGNLYGTTTFGGSSIGTAYCLDILGNDAGCGTIFEITEAGQFATSYSFSGGSSDGAFPNPLIAGNDDVFYGTSLSCNNPASDSACSNIFSYGALFKFTPAGATFLSLSTFPGSPMNLGYPNALVQAADGNLYGTTQVGGNTQFQPAGCLSVNSEVPSFGCGGIFQYEISTNTEADLFSFASNTPTAPGRHDSMPNTIIRQPGRGFPTGGNPWNFESDSSSVVEASDGSLYGTTPPACIVSPYNYIVDPATSCSSPLSSEDSTLFQFVLPTTVNITYTFSGNASAADGGGTTSGPTLASDNNFYVLSGPYIFKSPVFTTPFATFVSGLTPTSLIQGADGNFYGTASNGAGGAVFEVVGSPVLSAPIQLTLSPTQISLGSSTIAKWGVYNAFSMTAQQCYAFIQGGGNGGGSWTGLQTGSLSGQTFSGTSTITPTQTGQYTYALTCGGIESGFATLNVVQQQPTPTVTANPTTITISAPGKSGSTDLSLSNFTSDSFSVSCTGLPAQSSCELSNVTATGATLTITTTATTTSKNLIDIERRIVAHLMLLPAFVICLGGVPMRRKKRLPLTSATVVIFLLMFLSACGGGGGGNSGAGSGGNSTIPGTPVGASSVSVSVAAGSQSASVQITVNVQ
jgi:uncharacterized repeat protein (TIGR03803 family)